jgi:hypothetical protein
MLAELREDNKALAARLRETRSLCDEHRDVASASLIEQWIDEAEGEDLVPIRSEPTARFWRSLMRCVDGGNVGACYPAGAGVVVLVAVAAYI